MNGNSAEPGEGSLPEKARELQQEIDELEKHSKTAREAGLEESEKAIDRLIIEKQEQLRKLFE